jgi:hypothetical protein
MKKMRIIEQTPSRPSKKRPDSQVVREVPRGLPCPQGGFVEVIGEFVKIHNICRFSFTGK